MRANGKNLATLKQVIDFTSLSKSTILRMIAEGDFPKPIKLSERRRAWRVAALEDWLAGREAVQWA